jgi:hypothetical protein
MTLDRLQNDVGVTVGHAGSTLESPIVAEGFDVRGRMADGVSGVTFLLYAGQSGGSTRRVQCDKTLAAGVPGKSLRSTHFAPSCQTYLVMQQISKQTCFALFSLTRVGPLSSAASAAAAIALFRTLLIASSLC